MVYGKVGNFIPSRTLATFGDKGGGKHFHWGTMRIPDFDIGDNGGMAVGKRMLTPEQIQQMREDFYVRGVYKRHGDGRGERRMGDNGGHNMAVYYDNTPDWIKKVLGPKKKKKRRFHDLLTAAQKEALKTKPKTHYMMADRGGQKLSPHDPVSDFIKELQGGGWGGGYAPRKPSRIDYNPLRYADNGGWAQGPYRLPPAYTQNDFIKSLIGDIGGTFNRISQTPFFSGPRYTLQ
jgi:hypothetical protein